MSPQKSLYQRILGPYRISHHPLCENFEKHVYHIRGRKVCRGCFMQYLGVTIAIFLLIIGTYFTWWSGTNEIQIGLILYFLIIPTVITAFFMKNRILKDFSRFLLGVSFSVAFSLLIFTPNLLIKTWILMNFLPGYIYLNKRRAQKNNEVCMGCPENQNIPNCSGYQIYADRESIFTSQAISGGVYDPFAVPKDQLESSNDVKIQ